VVSVEVYADPQVTASVDNAEVCIDGTAILTGVLTGGTPASTFQWQEGTSPTGPWTDIGGETDATYAAPTDATGTFFYRVRILDPNSGCDLPASDAVTVIVATASISANNSQVCIGGNVTLSSIVTNGSTQRTLQWQSGGSATGPWTDISGATAATYIAPTTSNGVFYYRLQVLDPLSGCSQPVSNVLTITVTLDPLVSIAANNTNVCVGGSVIITATPTGGSGVFSYQWQSGTSTTGPWTDITSATTNVYNAPTTTAGTVYYRVNLTDNFSGCDDPSSNVVSIVVNTVPTVSINTLPPVCVNGPALFTATVTNGSGVFSYQWQSSTAVGGPFSNISGATNSTYNAPTATPGTMYYRVVLTDASSGCGVHTSVARSVVVYQDASVSIAPNFSQVCIGGTLVITATVSNGSGAGRISPVRLRPHTRYLLQLRIQHTTELLLPTIH
jgi:hypothetical protein